LGSCAQVGGQPFSAVCCALRRLKKKNNICTNSAALVSLNLPSQNQVQAMNRGVILAATDVDLPKSQSF
jgi:hypothetical protein